MFKKLNYEAIVTWVVIFAIAFFIFRELFNQIKPKNKLIYIEDVEIGIFDSIKDTKNITKIGDTLVIREHSWGRGKSYIWGKYKGYKPTGGAVELNDTTYYVYYNVVVRKK
jgi:hypothetical protein